MGHTWWKTIRSAVAVATVITATGCNKNPFSTDDGTHVRLRNSTSFELTNVTFKPGTTELKFQRIRPGEATNYVPVSNVYRYGYLDVLVDGERRVLQPVDYVGENFIGEGRYTYIISVDPSTLNPGVELVKD